MLSSQKSELFQRRNSTFVMNTIQVYQELKQKDIFFGILMGYFSFIEVLKKTQIITTEEISKNDLQRF